MVSNEKVPLVRSTSQNYNNDNTYKQTYHGAISPGPDGPLGSNGSLVAEGQTADRVAAGRTGQQDKEGVRNFSFSSLSSAKKWTLALLCVANTVACTCFSLLAPFFPGEATAKGMSQTAIGLVFSCYELWISLVSPIVGNYIVHIGARFAFIAGQFLAGGCSILFGFTYMVPAGDTFIALTFLLRSVMALGSAAFITASFTLAVNSFPDNVSVVYAMLEVFGGLGYMVGPTLGGVLYDLGGFSLPFYSSGVFLVLLSIITFFTLSFRNENVRPQKRQGSVLSLLASPLIVVCCVTLLSANYTFGFMDASLAIHLDQFSLSATVTGLCFVAVSGLYVASSPVFGWLSEKKNLSYPLLVIGNVVICVSLLLMGPSPLLPFLKARLGLKDGLELDGLLSGLLNSSIHFGSFLGPTIGSSVMEATSYEWSITLNAGICFFSFVLLVAYKAVERCCLNYGDGEPRRPARPDSPKIVLSDSHTSDTNDNLTRPAHTVFYEEEEF
ncbi:MFS-type transporter SLC18B1-like isoform X2 [Babylonia areolata]|uniref:MFS-type transporter SLC18B1-like isoform X2 n=1 Tax=Babylonia areolata TaxID=304850 RepID=UPI003FD43054